MSGFTEADLERAIRDGWRDEAIATAALQGVLASGGSGLSPKFYAEKAVAMADALMAELAKSKGKSS